MNSQIRWRNTQNMSRHVIVRTAYPYYSMGLRGVAAGANPSVVSGRGQDTPWISRQGHFDMQLSTARSWDLNQ